MPPDQAAKSAKPGHDLNGCAYVTLVTNDDFVIGARALARSIIACGADAPQVVMTTFDSTGVQSLAEFGARIVPVKAPQLSDGFVARHARDQIHGRNPFTKGNKPSFHTPLDNFAKLRLWQLTDYRCLVFLDADTLMLRSCDRLFAYPEFSAAPNLYEGWGDMHRLNSGVFVAHPNQATYDRMIQALDAPDAYWKRTDQTFLQAFFPNWHGLPYLYNCLQYVYFNMPDLWSWDTVRLLHYQYEKPWQADHPKADQLRPLIDLWHQVNTAGILPQWLK